MNESEKIKRVIAHLETQRVVIGEQTAEAALAVLRQQLSALGNAESDELQAPARWPTSLFVGRKAEFKAIKSRVKQLSEGQGRFVSIIGEAGIGKSRLVAELHSNGWGVDARISPQCLEGSAISVGGVVSYCLFRQIIRQYADIGDQDEERVSWNKLQSRLEEQFGETSTALLPYLATMIALHVRDEYVEQIKFLSGDAMRSQIFLAARRLFQRLAETQPLVLVLEDLQWIDESSALLLQHLVPLIHRVPILILGISRPTIDTPQSKLCDMMTTVYHDRYDEVHLQPLSSPESLSLVTGLFVEAGPSAFIAEKVSARAGGNPFIIEETIRSLIQKRLLCRDSSTREWQLAPEIDTAGVPLAIQDLIMARVDALGERLKDVVRIAAVIGRRFLFRVLVVVVHPAAEIQDQLEMLESLGLVVEDKRSSDLAYMFKHDLIHEVVYEHIEPAQRKGLHALVGSAIERSFADRLEEFFGVLAYHYSRAENWEKAQNYLFKSGDQAGSIAADDEALTCYTQAEHAYAQAFGNRWSPIERASLRRKMGEAFYRHGEHALAQDYLQQALAYLNQPLPVSRLGTRLRLVGELVEQVWNRIRPTQLPTGEEATTGIEEVIRTHLALMWIHSSNNLERYLLHTLALLNQAEQHEFPYGKGLGYAAVGVACDFVSFFGLAAHYHDRALKAAERSMHPIPLSHAYMAAAIHGSTLADWDNAIYFSDRAMEFFERVGDLKGWAYVSHLKSCALSYLGDYPQALAVTRRALEIMDHVGDPESISRVKWNEGYVLIRLGHLQEASESLREADALGQSVGNPITRVISCHELVLLDLLAHRLEEGVAGAQELERMLLQYRTTQYLCVPSHNAVTWAYLQKAEQSDGPDKGLWIQKARLACSRGLKQTKACYLGRPEAWRLKGVYHWIIGKPKAANDCWRRALAIAEETGQLHDTAVILREMGDRLHDAQCLERAERISERLRTEFEEEYTKNKFL